MLPPLANQRHTTTVYWPTRRLGYGSAALPYEPGTESETDALWTSSAPATSVASRTQVQFRPSTLAHVSGVYPLGARGGHHARPLSDHSSRSQKVLTAPTAGAIVSERGNAPCEPGTVTPQYWRTQAHKPENDQWATPWSPTASARKMNRTAGAGAGRDEDVVSDEDDAVFLVHPLEAARQGRYAARRRATHSVRSPSPALARLKEEAAQRLARRRFEEGRTEGSRGHDASTGSTVFSGAGRLPSGDKTSVSVLAPLETAPHNAAKPQATEDPDANALAVRLLFRHMLSGSDKASPSLTAQTTDEDARATCQGGREGRQQRTTFTSVPEEDRLRGAPEAGQRRLEHSRTSEYASSQLSGETSREGVPPQTVYDLRATAVHSVSPLHTHPLNPLGDGVDDDLTMESWHVLYAHRAKAESALRWLFYQEQYERALLMREEQENGPLAYYNALPGGARGMAVRRDHTQPPLSTDTEIHGRLNAALERLAQRAGQSVGLCSAANTHSSEVSKVPTSLVLNSGSHGRLVAPVTVAYPTTKAAKVESMPSPVRSGSEGVSKVFVSGEAAQSDDQPAATALAGLWRTAKKEKAQLFTDALALLDVPRRQNALLSEERSARAQLVRDYYQHHQLEQDSVSASSSDTAIDVLDRTPTTVRFAVAVVEGLAVLQAQVLAEHARCVDQLHESLTLQIITLHVFDRIVRDEARQREKLLAYHQFCLCVAAAQTADNVLPAANSSHGGPVLSPSQQVALPRYSTDVRQDPIRRLRQQRLRYIGPTDSPFCSYLRYLEINITERTEGDSRERAMAEEAQQRTSILCAAEQSHQRVALWEACVQGAALLIDEEARTRDAVVERRASERNHILAAVETYQRIAAARVAAQAHVMHFCEDALEQKQALESAYLAEHLKMFRTLRAECMLLAIQKSHEERDPTEMVMSWSIERSIFILVQQEHRLRDAVLGQEAGARTQMAEQRDFFEHDFWPSRHALKRREADAWECFVSVLFDEFVQRETLKAKATEERALLFEPRLMQPKGVLTMMATARDSSGEADAEKQQHRANTTVDDHVAAVDGLPFTFSASHLSQVLENAGHGACERAKRLPLVLEHRAVGDVDPDGFVHLTSNAASSEPRVPTFYSSLATTWPLSHSAHTYWDSAENAPLDAGCISGTSALGSAAMSASGEAATRALQYRLVQSSAWHPHLTCNATEDVADLLDITASLSMAPHAQRSYTSVDQPVFLRRFTALPPPFLSTAVAASSATGSIPPDEVLGAERAVRVHGVGSEVLTPPSPAAQTEFPSLTNAFVAETYALDNGAVACRDDTDDGDEVASGDAAYCPFPSLIFAFEEDRDLDLRRTVIANLSQFCDSDDLIAFFC